MASGWWRWLIVVGYMGLLFFVSAQSSLPEVPALPGLPIDKQHHFGAYLILSILVMWASSEGRWRGVTGRIALLAIVVSSAYGYTDECHQLFVPNRSYDLWDWVADTSGASAAAVFAWAWSILLRRRSPFNGV